MRPRPCQVGQLRHDDAFIVNLRLTDASADGDRAKIKDMAKTIGKWRDFGFDEGGMGQLNAALKTQANVILSENVANAGKFSGDEPEFYSMMKNDANRATFFVSGKQVASANDGQGTALIAALKQALPDTKARKAVSALLNQENARLLGYPQNKHRLSRRRSRRLSAPVASCRCRD